MEYLIIAGCQLFGIFFHTILKILEIDKRDPHDTFNDVARVFYRENLISLILSAGILLFMLFVHWVVGYTAPKLSESISHYMLYYYGGSVILGYQGQRLMYKILDKGANFIDRKIDEQVKQNQENQ